MFQEHSTVAHQEKFPLGAQPAQKLEVGTLRLFSEVRLV